MAPSIIGKADRNPTSKADRKAALDVGAWLFNVTTSVGIIMVNKQLMAVYGFSFGMYPSSSPFSFSYSSPLVVHINPSFKTTLGVPHFLGKSKLQSYILISRFLSQLEGRHSWNIVVLFSLSPSVSVSLCVSVSLGSNSLWHGVLLCVVLPSNVCFL
jgi:hypothetical protein